MILNVGNSVQVSYYIQQGISRSFIVENNLEITGYFFFATLEEKYDKNKNEL